MVAICTIGTGLVSSWSVAAVLLFLSTFTVVLWNVITVSLRQAIIPDGMLGRVNSVYRFFGWGAIPIGALIGGLLVAGLDGPLSRSAALRAPWIVAGAAQLVVAAVIGRRLTTARIDAARAAGAAGRLRCGRPLAPLTLNRPKWPKPGCWLRPGPSCVPDVRSTILLKV